MNTKIQIEGGHILVQGEYNSEFVAEARRLGGKWSAPYWKFDARNEAAVRSACMRCYGTDGLTSDLVSVRATLRRGSGHIAFFGGDKGPIHLFGLTLARAFGRDSGASVSEGVLVEQGGFGSGGSVKNWYTTYQDPTVVILHDISRGLVEECKDSELLTVEILQAPKSRAQELAEELERVKERIKEVEAELQACAQGFDEAVKRELAGSGEEEQ